MRRTYIAYAEILDMIIVSPDKDDKERTESLYQRLIGYEKTYETTSSSPSKPIPEKAKQLEVSLAELLIDPSYSTALHIFAQHPRLIPALAQGLWRSVKQYLKDPEYVSQEIAKAKESVAKMRVLVDDEWQPGELGSRLSPEMSALEERISNIAPHEPYPSENLVRDIQQIRTLCQSTPLSNDATVELLEKWKQLSAQPGLEEYPALWTALHIALGEFAKQYCEKANSEMQKNKLLKTARQAFSTPLKKSTLWKADPGTRRVCAAKLGEFCYMYGNDLEMSPIELAKTIHDTYFDVLLANERLYQRSRFREDKERWQARGSIAVAYLIESCVYLAERNESDSIDWRREAFMIADNGKSRMLREEMALAERLPPRNVSLDLCEKEKQSLDLLREKYVNLAARKHDLSLGPATFDEFNDERNELRLDLEEVWAQMEDYGDAARAYVAVRRDEALQWGELQWDSFQRVADRLGENVALVSISLLPDSVFLSVLHASWEAPKVCIVPLAREELLRYLHSYETEILNRYDHLPKHEWQRLGEKLFAPLEQILDVECVYFLPHGPLHRLPLHALTIDDVPFIERWAVAYAPSISVLESILARPSSEETTLILGYDKPEDPAMILREACEVARYFQTEPRLREDANSAVLEKYGSSARLIHLACHGQFESKEPLDSGVELADGRFTARDWLRLRLRADLVTLSACQTGRSDIRPGDDLVGLMRAILFAGASSLLMTLWSVSGPETRDWMLKFYECVWNEERGQIVDKAAAFRSATLELRKNWPDPYYWAPFILVGNFQ